MGTVLRWMERLLFAIAALCLVFVGVTRWEAAYFRAAAHNLAATAPAASDTTTEPPPSIEDASVLPSPDEAVAKPVRSTTAASSVATAALIGELAIPHLGITTAILEGDSAQALRRGAGHLTGSALPGQPGNTVLAGHRDTVFRRLSEIRRGDRLKVTTRTGTFTYHVTSTLRVMPRDVWVLKRDAAALTLITCYPFTWVGSAPERWVVQAERDSTEGNR
jgi:sortase A